MSREEFERLLIKVPAQHRGWLELLTLLMCRPGEVESLQLEDVDRRGETWEILVRGTKNRYAHRKVPLVGRARAVVEVALSQGRAKGPIVPVWANVRRDLPLACEAAEIQGLRPTDLRASSMTWLIEEGVPEHLVARLARHRDETMLRQRYLRRGGRGLREAAEQLAGSRAPPGEGARASPDG